MSKSCYLCAIRKAIIKSGGVPVCGACAEEHLVKQDAPENIGTDIESVAKEFSIDSDLAKKWIDLGVPVPSANPFEENDWDDDDITPVLRKS